MIVTLDSNGELDLLDIFTEKEAAKIYYYTFQKQDNKIVLLVYDKLGKKFTPRLRKRGKAKK
jgi:hypothetical protein